MSATPGPWMVNKYGSVGAGERGAAPIIAYIEPLYGEDAKHGDHNANARLIAAAPELLAALTRLWAAWLQSDPGAEHNDVFGASAAIARAEGR